MKRFKYIIVALLGGSILFTTSCKKWVEGINENPNNATDAPLSAVMTAALVGLIQPHSGEDARLAGIWTQQFTGTDRQYAGFDSYIISTADFDWDGPYYSCTQQAKICESKAKSESNSFYEGLSILISAHSFGMLTAGWGDIPYSQANDIVNYPSPMYDAQMDVYDDVQARLSAAIAALTANTGGDVYGVDFYFGGDHTMWIKVAHTLKARFYLHTGDFAAAKAEAAMGVMSSADNWMIPHPTGAYNQDMNLYHSFCNFDRQGYMTAPGAYLPELLNPDAAKVTGMNRNHAKTDESARFAEIYVGDTATDYDLNLAGMYWSATSPFTLVSAVENLLISAEAKARTADPGGALTDLNLARAEVAAMFPGGTYTDFVTADFDGGGIEDNGKGSNLDNMIYEILEEKYVSLVGQMEVFNDMRRTNNYLGLTPKTGTAMPERFLYPEEEISGNLNAPQGGNIPGVFEPTEVNK